MSEEVTRPPTPAKYRVSPLIELSNGSLYPYWNLHQGGITPYLDAVRRALSSINPFSHQQIPTSERMGLNVKVGKKYYREQPYPSSVAFSDKYPSHYDALSEQRFKNKPYLRHVHAMPQLVLRPMVPRFCERQIKNFKRCVMANDQREQVCKNQQQNIVAICPQWALHNLKQKKLALLKDQALSNKKYKEAMEVSAYNKGRSVADVPHKSWEDGSRNVLRPDTLWADDRYADITKEQIEAAKARVKQRRQANPQKKAEYPIYDRTYQAPPAEVPLYSV